MKTDFPSIELLIPFTRQTTLLSFGVLLLFIVPFAAAEQVIDKKIQFEIVRIDGTIIKSAIRIINSQAIELEQAGTQQIDLRDLLKLTALKKPNANPLPHQLFLSNGDRVFVDIISSDEEYLVARCPAGMQEANDKPQTLKIPVEFLAGAIRQRILPEEKQIHFFKSLFSPGDDADLLELKNGDTLRCELLRSNTKLIQLKTAATELQIPIEKVQLICFNPAYRVLPQATEISMLVRLSDNSLLTLTPNRGSRLPAKAGYLLCQSAWGSSVYVALEHIQEIQMLGNRIQNLSELTPKSFRHTPYVGKPILLQKNRSAVYGPLMINKKYFARGLGLKSRTELIYQLNKQYQAFYSLIGFDDTANGLGHTEITIWQNQMQIYSTTLTNRTTSPLAIGPLDLSGAETLTIKIDYGNRGDIMDRVNLCHPVIIRKQKSPAQR